MSEKVKKTQKATPKKVDKKLRPKYNGIYFRGKIYRNPLTEKDVKELEKHPAGENLFE